MLLIDPRISHGAPSPRACYASLGQASRRRRGTATRGALGIAKEPTRTSKLCQTAIHLGPSDSSPLSGGKPKFEAPRSAYGSKAVALHWAPEQPFLAKCMDRPCVRQAVWLRIRKAAMELLYEKPGQGDLTRIPQIARNPHLPRMLRLACRKSRTQVASSGLWTMP